MQNGAASTAIVAVGQAKSALSDALDTQTKAIGVILPPPDIRAIVDKTAQFVARNGVEFEKRILANEINNQKFNFLKDGDPYNAYYRKKVADFGAADKGEAEGGAAAAAAGGSAAPAAPAPVAAAPAPVAEKPKAALPPTKPLEAPEPEQYTVHIPEGLTMLDLDTIKLTAQFVARNGKSFLTGLASREHANPQFYFLKPTHSLFAFFTSLCDAYSRVLMPPKDLRAKLEKDAADRTVILERALRRLEWERVQETEAKQKAAREEAEREAMLSVDWHEFAVVETIEFYDDETDELPPPMTVKDIMRMAKAGMKYQEPEPEAAAAAAAAQQQQGMEMDEEERALVAQGAGAGAPAAGGGGGGGGGEDMDMDVSDDEGAGAGGAAAAGLPPPEEEEDEGPMRVVKNYRRAVPQQQSYDPTKMVVSPITGELVPLGEMAEHMRISLIDPKYREQKEAMMAKIRDTAKASDDEIGKNLVSLSRTLPHIFGTTAEEMTALVGKQIAEQRAKEASAARAALPAPVPQGPAQPLPPPSAPLPEMPQVAVPPPGMAPPRQAPAMPPPSRPPPSLPPPGQPPLAAPQAPPRPAVPPPAASAPAPPRPAAAAPAAAPPQQQAPPAGAAPMPARPPAPMPVPPLPRPPLPPVPMGVPTTRGPPLPPMPYGGPPPLPPRDAPPLPEDDGHKRRADTFVLTPEEEYADQHPGQQKVYVLCPTVDGSETLKGQLLAVEMASLMATVADLKARLSEVLALAPGRQQLSREHVGILKNELSLAFYNVGTDVQLQLGLKERGGRKR